MAKYAAKGTVLAYLSATGPDVYSTIPGVQDFELPLGEKEEIDVTSHDSSGSDDESVLGINVREAFDVPMVWDGAATHHAALVTRKAADTATTFKITARDGKVYGFVGLIKSIKISFPVRGAQLATVTIKPTGSITVT
jgi:predicted secreted protein